MSNFKSWVNESVGRISNNHEVNESSNKAGDKLVLSFVKKITKLWGISNSEASQFIISSIESQGLDK